VHELTYGGARLKCKAYQRRWLKLSIAFKVGQNFISSTTKHHLPKSSGYQLSNSLPALFLYSHTFIYIYICLLISNLQSRMQHKFSSCASTVAAYCC
jgi:hypothetical protein